MFVELTIFNNSSVATQNQCWYTINQSQNYIIITVCNTNNNCIKNFNSIKIVTIQRLQIKTRYCSTDFHRDMPAIRNISTTDCLPFLHAFPSFSFSINSPFNGVYIHIYPHIVQLLRQRNVKAKFLFFEWT